MENFIFLILKHLGMLVLWFIIFVGVTFIGFAIYYKIINEESNVVFAFILGSATGTVAGWIIYIVADLVK